MAANIRELDSFLSKFKFLSSAGFKAAISFKTENFVTNVSLDVELPFVLPPCNLPPPFSVFSTPKSRRHRSPSYYRRLQRRRDARSRSEVLSSLSDSVVVNNVNDAAMPQVQDSKIYDGNDSSYLQVVIESNEEVLDVSRAEAETVGREGEADVTFEEDGNDAHAAMVDKENDAYVRLKTQDDVINAENVLIEDHGVCDDVIDQLRSPVQHVGYTGYYPMPRLEFWKS